MNFLAHLYLSKNNKNILIGNFIADAVKGKHYHHFNDSIQKGIIIHREIDSYTDAHPIVRNSKRRLHPRYRHYDGVIIDILYDHYLAKNWSMYSEIPLDIYASSVYSLLQENHDILPDKIQKYLPFMVGQNWLLKYQTIEGISDVLKGMNGRTKGVSKMDLATEDLKEHYQEFEDDFTRFLKDLTLHLSKTFTELTN